MTVIEIGHAADIMGRSKRAKFDLDELGRREFEFILGLGRGVVTVAFAEPADGLDREFLLTLKANAGTGGKSKNIFGLNVLPGTGILRSRATGATRRTRCSRVSESSFARSGAKPPVWNSTSRSPRTRSTT